VAICSLDNGTTYYWQVRAVNGDGTNVREQRHVVELHDAGAAPSAFGKVTPATGPPTRR